MNVWRLTQGQRWVQWPGQAFERELRLAELESELEMRPESKPGAELPSALLELQQEGKIKRKNIVYITND